MSIPHISDTRDVGRLGYFMTPADSEAQLRLIETLRQRFCSFRYFLFSPCFFHVPFFSTRSLFLRGLAALSRLPTVVATASDRSSISGRDTRRRDPWSLYQLSSFSKARTRPCGKHRDECPSAVLTELLTAAVPPAVTFRR